MIKMKIIEKPKIIIRGICIDSHYIYCPYCKRRAEIYFDTIEKCESCKNEFKILNYKEERKNTNLKFNKAVNKFKKDLSENG